jgi:hypothetical protein
MNNQSERPKLMNDELGAITARVVEKVRNSRISNDLLLALETRIITITKLMRENKTIAAYEEVRQLQEFVAYERAKQSAQ